MRTTINMNEQLLDRLVEVGGFRTRTEAIQAAVEEFITKREREALLDLAGKVEFAEGHLHVLNDLEVEE